MPVIHTPRLVLVPATVDALRAELEGRAAFARVIGATVPEDWPPELYDEGAIRWSLGALERDPGFANWGLYYIVLPTRSPESDDSIVIGTGGIKGPPNPAGLVEIGYAILPAWRRRGYAREAADGWLAWAFSDPRVTRVVAHTLPELTASIGVLRSAGFIFAGPGEDPGEPEAIRYEIARESYARGLVDRATARW